MKVALADVRRWEPGGVETAFTGYGTAHGRLLDLDADLTGSRPPDGWLGTSGDLARGAHERLAGRLRRVTAGVSTLRPSIAQAADDVADLRRELAVIEALAAARGFTLGPDGVVTDARQTVDPIEQVEAHRQLRTAERDEIVLRLEGVLRRADEIDTALADLLVRAANEQVDDGLGTSLRGVATAADRQVTLFRSVTGRDPLTEQDWRVAATLDPNLVAGDLPAEIVVARIEPVPGAGLVHGGAFIAGRDVWGAGIPLHLGDDRSFDPAAGPEDSRVSFLVDYENGIVVVRQNPTHDTSGGAGVGVPQVGVEQDADGRVRLQVEALNPLAPGIAEMMGVTVRGDVVVNPRGGPHDIPRVDGTVGQYPSWEAYHSLPGQPPTPVLQRGQNLGDADVGPLVGLPWPGAEVGQQPERLDEWRQRHHPDQVGPAEIFEAVDGPWLDVHDSFHNYPLPPLPTAEPNGAGGLSVPDAPRVG